MEIFKSIPFKAQLTSGLLILMMLKCFGQYATPAQKVLKIDSIKQLIPKTNLHAVKVNHMISVGRLYLSGKFVSLKDKDSAFNYATSVIKLGKQTNNFETEAKGIILKAEVFQIRGQYTNAILMLNQKIDEAEGNKDNKSIAFLYKVLGEIYSDRGLATGDISNLLKSERCFNSALNRGEDILNIGELVETSVALASVMCYTDRNEESIKILRSIINQYEGNNNLNPKLLARAYTKLAMNYRKLEQYQKAISFAKKALEISKNPSNTYLAYTVLGQASEKNNNLKKARDYYSKALHQIEEVDIYKTYNLLERLGSMSLELKDFKTSIKYYQRAIAYSKQFPESYNGLSILSQYGLSQAYYQNGQFSQSKKNTSKILKFLTGKDVNLKHNKYKKVLGDSYLLMSQLTEKDREYEESLINYKRFSNIQEKIEYAKDSIFKLEKLKTIKELEQAFKAEKKDKEISILKANNNLQSFENNQQWNFAIGFGIISVFLLILLFIVLKILNLKQRTRKTIEEKYEENKLLMGEIHHRVKNNLQIIISLLNAQINGAKNDEKLQIALKESQTKIKSMAIIHQSLYNSQTYTKVKVNDYFEELLDEVKKTFETKGKIIKFETNVEQKEINMSLAVPIGLIVNELVTNTYKYAFRENRNNNRVTVNFNSTKALNTYKLTVLDNGIGLPDNFDMEKLSSFGMQLVKGLVDQLQGTITILESKGAGYEIFVVEPQEVVKIKVV